MMSGYTLSYRDKWNHPVFKNFHEVAVWSWLCDMAVWQETRVNYCGQMVTLQRGQIITSRSYIAKGFEMGEQKVRTLLARLENDGMINQRPTSHGTIITICNYNKFQDLQPEDKKQTNQHLTSRQPATNHNKKEYKQDKEVKERKKNIYTDEFEEFWKLYPKPDDKAGTFKKYKTALKETDHETIINGVKRYIDAKPWGSDLQYCRQSTTWLAKRSWETIYSNNQPRGDTRAYTTGQSSYERGILASLQSAKDYEDEF